jgi:hypothetical protein
MALSTYALVSVAELKELLSIDSTLTAQDSVLENVINRASESIETFLGRRIATRGSTTEYHTVESGLSEVCALNYPVTTVTSVDEGEWQSGTWTSEDTLTHGTDYVYDAAAGVFVRLEAYWPSGQDAIRLVYTAGYAAPAAVPGDIKSVALSLAARKYSQIKRGGDFAAQTITDGMGSVSRFLPADLLKIEKEQLYPWRSHAYIKTGRII